jgi:alpha-D-xyloside xylohydrolase
MKIRNLIIAMLPTMLAANSAFALQKYTNTENGVIVNLQGKSKDGASKVRLQVLGDKLIRVSATADNDFAPDASLAVLPQKAKTPFTVTDSKTGVTVATPSVKAVVEYKTGRVSFYDLKGNEILAEEENGRTFTPITVEGTSAYTVQQRFESLDDNEGIYGLGQHQADEFNYKGKNEDLFQYNTKVSVPFVVSTRNYGILWDSYSYCRWGSPDDYLQMGEAFKLYDKDGKEGALTGTYQPAEGKTLVRREPNLYFEHLLREDLTKVINLPEGFQFNGSNVTYEGDIVPDATGEYKFILYYSGYQKVFINDSLVVPERWRTAWNPNSYKFSVNLQKGKRTHLKIEWIPNGGVAYCGLRTMKPVSASESAKMRWWGEMQDMIDYYFVYGSSMDDVISGYRTLTGKAPIMPKWVMGYWQSREKYNTRGEVLNTLAEFRKRQIPIDNIVIDWLHWPIDSWGSHEFDPVRFPDPKGMVDSIHEMNGRVMVSVWPKFYVTTEHYKEFDRNGWMYQQAVKDSIRDWVGPGYLGSFYDAYSPEARKLFWHQIQDHYVPLGIDAWWMDASEPNVRDCVDIQYRKDLCGPTALGPSAKYFNAYALVNAEAIYDGQRSSGNDARVFLLTRSGFAGLQRYSTATWSGDIATRWEDLRAQISAGLNFAISGIPFWSMDIGGFCVEDRYVAAEKEFEETGVENADLKEWRELNTRWYQFGAFAPMFRAHGQWPFREVFNLAPEDHPAYKSIVYYTKLRYSLMPYIYSLAGMVHFDDYTIMRALVLDYESDMNVRNLKDQFMFGPAFMVAPVTEYGARQRNVYLPEGTWYDYYTGKTLTGGQTVTVDAPYEQVPLFVRGGSIVTFGPDIQWCNEKPDGVINIYVYAGKDCDFTLYEDEGINYNYEQGKYSKINLHWDEAKSTLTIGSRDGSYEGMPVNRQFNVIKVDAKHPTTFNVNTIGKMVDYSGNEIKVNI